MSAECSGGGSCETGAGRECDSSDCPCGVKGCSGDPMDCAMGMWSSSFFCAMKALQVDILKAKIQKAWGSKMEKAADAVIDAMGTEWQAMLAKAQAKSDLRQRLQGLWQEGRK